MKVLKRDKNPDGKNLYTISIFDETFDNIEVKKDCSDKKSRYCSKCKHHEKNNGVVRFFDCPRRLNIATKVYSMFTTIIVFAVAMTLFFALKLSFLRSLAFLILFLVVFDIICTTLETVVPIIRDRLFYKKLKKAKEKRIAKETAEKQKQESKKHQEEIDRSIKDPNYKNVLDAEKNVKALEALCNKFDFGMNKENLKSCIQKLFIIINLLKEDCSGYGRVAFLFESSLPNLYNSLSLYSNYIKAECVEEDLEQMISNAVEKFSNYLKTQKVQAIMDKVSVEAQLMSNLATFNQMMDKGD